MPRFCLSLATPSSRTLSPGGGRERHTTPLPTHERVVDDPVDPPRVRYPTSCPAIWGPRDPLGGQTLVLPHQTRPLSLGSPQGSYGPPDAATGPPPLQTRLETTVGPTSFPSHYKSYKSGKPQGARPETTVESWSGSDHLRWSLVSHLGGLTPTPRGGLRLSPTVCLPLPPGGPVSPCPGPLPNVPDSAKTGRTDP